MTIEDQQRIDELEIKAAFQEQLIADLNDELVQHGKRIAEMEQQLQRLIDHVQSMQTKDSGEDEPPPHY